jgi:hypothetical protein
MEKLLREVSRDLPETVWTHIKGMGRTTFNMALRGLLGKNSPQIKPREKIPRELFGVKCIPVGFAKGTRTRVGFPLNDTRHKIVQGATGMGKTEWGINYTIERARRGEGTAYLDNASGNAMEKILNGLPKECLERTVVLDHSNRHFPLPLGFYMNGRNLDIFMQDELVQVWLSFFIDNLGVDGQYMTQELIANTCRAVFAASEKNTLLDVIQMASNPVARANVLKKLNPNTDADVIGWWHRFNLLSAREQRFITDSFMRRAGLITSQRTLQHMLCQHPRNPYPYRRWLDEGYTVLITCREMMGSLTTRIVMSIHVLNFWMAALGRQANQGKPFLIIADEPQTWLPGNEIILDNLYSKGRQYGLIIASMFQSSAQVSEQSPTLLKKILDNQPDLVLFKCDRSVIKPPGMEDLSNITRYNFLLRVGDLPFIECSALGKAPYEANRSDLIQAHTKHWGTYWEKVHKDIMHERREVLSDGENHEERPVHSLTPRPEETSSNEPDTTALLPLLPNRSKTDADAR